ncbi:membrane protein [Campylobacter fetus subsp. venerealis str. 84-112]|nr:membrane protein [Campylobacter fetus subsp. venerealis str. 84-112]
MVCFVLCVIASYMGRVLGEMLESKALVLGGVILILIGCKIIITHLIN